MCICELGTSAPYIKGCWAPLLIIEKGEGSQALWVDFYCISIFFTDRRILLSFPLVEVYLTCVLTLR